MVNARTAPTAIAAGRLRPARDFFRLPAGGSCTESSAGMPPPVSVSATDVFAERPLDLQQLAFLVFDQVFDLVHVLLGGLIQILLSPRDLILTGFAVFADAVQLLHRLAADVAYRHLGVLAFGFRLLDQLATAFLGQLRYRDPDQRAVVGGVEPEVGVADRRLDVAELTGLVRL